MITLIFICFITIIPLTTIIHELGHLFMAQIFAVKKLRLTIGAGPVIKKWKVFDSKITLRLFFFLGGYTTTDTDKELKNWKRACIALGGPLINGVVGVGLLVPGFGVGSDPITYWFQWFAIYNLWVCIANIIPYKRNEKKTDGYLIYEMISEKGN